jgi:hypothetical protein
MSINSCIASVAGFRITKCPGKFKFPFSETDPEVSGFLNRFKNFGVNSEIKIH